MGSVPLPPHGKLSKEGRPKDDAAAHSPNSKCAVLTSETSSSGNDPHCTYYEGQSFSPFMLTMLWAYVHNLEKLCLHSFANLYLFR